MRSVLSAILLLASVAGGMCHGYLAMPAARNVQHNSDYCPHCLNGPEVCGDPAGQHHHETGGKYGTSRTVRAYASGGLLKARVVITANHVGRWSLSLCPKRIPTKKCFKRLKLADGKGSYVYLSHSAHSSSATFRIPRGTKCKQCVVRWLYETGNSCTPRGTPRRYANPGLGMCGVWMNGETFANCADVRIK